MPEQRWHPRRPRRQPFSKGPPDAEVSPVPSAQDLYPRRDRWQQQQQQVTPYRPCDTYGNYQRRQYRNTDRSDPWGLTATPHAESQHAADAGGGGQRSSGGDAPFKTYLCPGCKQHFDFWDRNGVYIGRVPLVLKCCHTMCQDCIYKRSSKLSVECAECGKTSAVPPLGTQDELQDVFSVNYFVAGMIMWHRTRSGRRAPDIKMVPAKVVAPPSLPEEEKEDGAGGGESEKCCMQHCTRRADVRCDECGEVLCEPCFSLMHTSVKALRHHTAQPIRRADRLLLPQCHVHPSTVELLCLACDEKVCIYCYLEGHEGHERIHLNRPSTEEKEELTRLKNEVKKVLRQVIATRKKIDDLLEYDPSEVVSEACAAFAARHARLWVAEGRVRREAAAAAARLRDGGGGLGAASASAAALATRLRRLLNTEALAGGAVDVRELLDALREAARAPRFLAAVTEAGAPPVTPPPPPVRLEAAADPPDDDDDEGGAALRAVATDARYELVGEDQLPDGYEPDAADADDAVRSPSPPPPPRRASSEDSNSSTRRRAPLMAAPKHVKRHDLENETVRATYIRSMDSVYLHIKKQSPRLRQLCASIVSFVTLEAGESKAALRPQQNELYLAVLETRAHREWGRARVLAVRDGPAGEGDGDGPTCDVIFIDYGNEQTVGARRLRPLPAALSLARHPPLAYECRVAAPGSAQWARNAHLELSRLVHERDLIVRLAGGRGGVPTVPAVDLLVVAPGGSGPTSVVDLLVYARRSLATREDAVPVGFEPLLRVFPNGTSLRRGRSDMVVLANVVDPHNVFVHLASHEAAYERMRQELRRHYRGSQPQRDADPTPGTYAAVEYEGGGAARGRWQRALLADVDAERGTVRVLLVDWGGDATVPLSAVHPLRDSFARLESQAVLVRLAHVEPPHGQHGWPEPAVDYLRAFQKSREALRMLVVAEAAGGLPPRVALFDVSSGAADISLNARLAALNAAEATGPFAAAVEWTREAAAAAGGEPGDAAPTDPDSDNAGGLVDQLLHRIHRQAVDGGDDDDEKDDDEGPTRQRVEVVRVVDPGQIFIKFRDKLDQEERLFREMQVHYNTAARERRTEGDWGAGDWCAARVRRGYCRAKVVAKVGPSYLLYLPDHGECLTADADDLFILDDYFRAFPQVVFACHLAGVRPAGDSGRWSASATDALSRLIVDHPDVHLAAAGSYEEREGSALGGARYRSLPAKIWYRPPDAIDHCRRNRGLASAEGALIKLGYAYRVRPEGGEVAAAEEGAEASEAQPSWAQQVETEMKATAADGPEGGLEETETAVAEEEVKENGGTGEPVAAPPESPYRAPREVVLTDWMPPFRLERREFGAVVTCAETEGGLFLHDEQLHAVYENLERRLFSYFAAAPRKAPARKGDKWRSGRMCTVAWEGGWYRARVLGRGIDDPRRVRILMVDFGSDHEVAPADVREEILFPDVPPFATKTKLDGLRAASGSWLPSDYDRLLRVLREGGQRLRVTVCGPLDVDVPHVRVTLPDGADLAHTLESLSPNLMLRPPLGPPAVPAAAAAPAPDEDDAVVEEEEELLLFASEEAEDDDNEKDTATPNDTTRK